MRRSSIIAVVYTLNIAIVVMSMYGVMTAASMLGFEFGLLSHATSVMMGFFLILASIEISFDILKAKYNVQV
jgi:hypothetical protein